MVSSLLPFLPFLFPSLALAFPWQFTSSPHQCETLSLSASGGSPPYTFLMIPSGPSLLSNEVRSIQSIPFNDSSHLSFSLNYPANESFVGVVSDSKGFGTGGTTLPVTVLSSNTSSCYDASKSVTAAWTFSSSGTLTQCQPTRFWWQQQDIQGSIFFRGVIPGGDSFNIPVGQTTQDSNGTGFSWTADVSAQTIIFIVAGDDRGPVGSAVFTVFASQDSSCLNNDSPSSTAGSPAGGTYPTNKDGSTTNGGGNSNGSGGSGTNVGAIVGGVIGGIAGLIILVLLAWFLLFRKRRRSHYNKERPINILQDDDDDTRHAELPQYYAPEPFMVPDPTIASTTDATSVHDAPRTPASALRPGTPAGMSEVTSSSRKTGMSRLRPVNIVQHEDAGPSMPSPDGADEPETVELPPAYTNIRKAKAPTADAAAIDTSANATDAPVP